MKSTLIRFAAVAAFAAGMMLPQTALASDNDYHLGDVDRQARRRGFGYDPDKMMYKLDLSRSQSKQADRLFKSTHERTKPMRAALEENGGALHAAFDSHDYARIRLLTHKQNALMTNMVAAYCDAKISFYRILTPEQRVKADRLNLEYRHPNRSIVASSQCYWSGVFQNWECKSNPAKEDHAMIWRTGLPFTSVKRKWRPWNLNVSFV